MTNNRQKRERFGILEDPGWVLVAISSESLSLLASMINSARHLITVVFSLLMTVENCISGSKSTTFAADSR